ncbi:MAG: MBL fold metallo-hydrolase [Ruminococcus sp.]|nr:MBL fold metallo-hydrolase [Ruminococcus sp.]
MLDKITVIEHSAVRIGAEKIIYFDPFHLKDAPHDADVIFITHDHFDHFSPEDIAKAAKADTVFAAPAAMKGDFGKIGIDESRVTFMAPEESAVIAGIPTEAVRAYNTFKPFHTKGKGWLGYVVTVDGTRVYVCGDTDDTPDARAVKCDIICVPIGGTYTMDAKSAAELVKAVKPQCAIPIHYGSVAGKPADAETFKKNVGDAAKVVVKIH